MAEAPEQGADHKRATWVALRTLRRRPKVVGRRRNGELIYDIGSVRLVLRDGADHFNRLSRCSKCRHGVLGAPVLNQADLTRVSQSVICKECVRKGTGDTRWVGLARQDDPGPPAAQEVMGPSSEVVDPVFEAAGEARVAAVESQIATMLARLTDLADEQESEAKHRREADDAVGSEMRAAVLQGLVEIRGRLAPIEVGRSAVDALEERVERTVAGLVELVQSQRSELGALVEQLADTRSELQRVAAFTAELAAAQRDTGRRLAEMATWSACVPTSAELLGVFRAELGETEARLTRSDEAQRAELHAELSDGLQQARTEVASLEQQLRGSAAELRQLVESQRHELGAAVGDTLRNEMAPVAEAVQYLTGDRLQLRSALEGLLQRTMASEVRLDGLAASAEAGASRLQQLEVSTGAATDRLTVLIEHERREREAIREVSVREKQPDRATQLPPVGGPLLDALDLQLEEAGRRLARRMSSANPE